MRSSRAITSGCAILCFVINQLCEHQSEPARSGAEGFVPDNLTDSDDMEPTKCNLVIKGCWVGVTRVEMLVNLMVYVNPCRTAMMKYEYLAANEIRSRKREESRLRMKTRDDE